MNRIERHIDLGAAVVPHLLRRTGYWYYIGSAMLEIEAKHQFRITKDDMEQGIAHQGYLKRVNLDTLQDAKCIVGTLREIGLNARRARDMASLTFSEAHALITHFRCGRITEDELFGLARMIGREISRSHPAFDVRLIFHPSYSEQLKELLHMS